MFAGGQTGADVLPTEGGKPVGKILVQQGSHALAMLRLRAGLEAATHQSAALVTSHGAAVKPHRPAWWPADWGEEDP